MAARSAELEAFFLEGKVTLAVGDCYAWGRSRSPQGYGKVWDNRAKRNVLAHRLAWELANERPVPAGQVIRHDCDNKWCVNPYHLQPGTQRQNVIEAIERGLATPGAYQLDKTHCPQNHPYVEGNIYHRSNGSRMCATCHKDRNRKVK